MNKLSYIVFTVLLISSSTTFAANDSAKKAKKGNSATKKTATKKEQNPQETSLTKADIATNATPISPFSLNENQVTTLLRLFVGLVQFEEGTGNHKAASEQDFATFSVKLNQRLYSAGLDINGLDLSERGAVQQWLMDQRFHPYLRFSLQALRDHPGKDFMQTVAQSIATEKKLSVAEVKTELSQISYMLQPGFSLQSNTAIGLPKDGSYPANTRQKAFVVGSENRPLELDPEVANMIEQLKTFRAEISQISFERDPSLLNRIREHFQTFENLYESIWQATVSLEASAYDVQGLLDTVRYKLLLPEVDTEVERARMSNLLDAVTTFRRQIFQVTQTLVETPLTKFSLNLSGKALEGPMADAEHISSAFKRFAAKTIVDLDAVVGLDRRTSDSLKRDTPWELKFQQDKKQRFPVSRSLVDSSES